MSGAGFFVFVFCFLRIADSFVVTRLGFGPIAHHATIVQLPPLKRAAELVHFVLLFVSVLRWES